MVILGLLEMHDLIDFQVKPGPLGLVLALVDHELLCDGFAELLLSRWNSWPDLRTLLWGTGYPFELAHVLHPGHRKMGKVGPLEIVVYDPDFLWIMDGEALAPVDRQSVTETPVICLDGRFRCLYADIYGVVQN